MRDRIRIEVDACERGQPSLIVATQDERHRAAFSDDSLKIGDERAADTASLIWWIDHERMELPNTHVRVPSADPACNDAVDLCDANRTHDETLLDSFARALDRRPRRRSYMAEHLDEKFRAALAPSHVYGIKICDLHRDVVTLEVDRMDSVRDASREDATFGGTDLVVELPEKAQPEQALNA